MQLLFHVIIELLYFVIFLLEVFFLIFTTASESNIFLCWNNILIHSVPWIWLWNRLPKVLFGIIPWALDPLKLLIASWLYRPMSRLPRHYWLYAIRILFQRFLRRSSTPKRLYGASATERFLRRCTAPKRFLRGVTAWLSSQGRLTSDRWSNS